jgi:Skp family chaperone for outer membrane proteins
MSENAPPIAAVPAAAVSVDTTAPAVPQSAEQSSQPKSVLAPAVAKPAAPEPPAYKARLQALQTQLKELSAMKAEQAKAADDSRRSALSEREKLEEDRKALQAERDALRQTRRKDAMAKLGILEKAAALAPDVDPADPTGAATLEAWAKDNPEFVRRADPQTTPYDAPQGSRLARILTGAEKSPLISRDGLRKLLGG